MSLVQTPADDPKMAAEEDHEVAAATKSGRPTAKDAALLAFVSSIGPFAANAYVPAFDEIGQHYGVGLVTVQQTLSIYLAAFACTSLLIGAASDAFGRKAVLALSMTVFAVSSLGLLFADSMEAFFIWRFVMGMAAAAGPVVTQAIVRDRWSGGDAAKIIALIAVIFGLAPALGGDGILLSMRSERVAPQRTPCFFSSVGDIAPLWGGAQSPRIHVGRCCARLHFLGLDCLFCRRG